MKYWDVEERLPVGPIEWPNGARLAVLVAFDYQSEVGDWTLPNGDPHYGQITEWSYSGRVAIWRLLDSLERHGVKATFNTCGMTAELYPESCQEIVAAGHEIAGHTYSHRWQWELSEDEERHEEVRKTIDAIGEVTGERIVGWRSPSVQPSPNTLRILVEEGFKWDGNFLNYDLPYMLDVPGTGSLVEVPYTFSTDDFPFIYGTPIQQYGGFPGPRQTMANLYQILKDEFDVLYAESATSPRMFKYQNHPTVVGRAHRSIYFDRFLEYMKGHDGVWFARIDEVADWWLSHYDKPQDQAAALRTLGFASSQRAGERTSSGSAGKTEKG